MPGNGHSERRLGWLADAGSSKLHFVTYSRFTAACFIIVGALGFIAALAFVGGACLLGLPRPGLCCTYQLEAPLNGLWLAPLILIFGLLRMRHLNRRLSNQGS